MFVNELRHVAVVANPYSGSRRNRELVEVLIQELHLADLVPVPMWGKDDLKAAAAASDFASRFRCVIAAGGDGTLHSVINTQRAVPVAMFPIGTENLFARQFGYTRDPVHMTRIIAQGKTAEMDLGKIGGRMFSIVASAGYDGEVIHRLDRWRTAKPGKLRRVKRLSYARHLLMAALRYRFPVMEIEADGRKLRGALCMTFVMPQYGLGLRICPHAVVDDGLLDYMVLEKPGVISTAMCGLAVMRGTHPIRAGVHVGRAKQIRITCPDPVPMELDGEEGGFTPVDISVVPKGLRVLVP